MSTTMSVDWVAHWRALVEARHEQGRRLDREHRRPDAWSGRAQRFARHVAHAGDDPLLQRLLARVDASTTVLDIGAGPGRHSLSLARVARSVTAVEPSAAMREILEQNVAEAGLTNVQIVPAEWPGADPTNPPAEPADVVICSHVLYPVVEVEPFLRALDAVTRRACFVVMRVGQREGPYLDLFQEVWGEPRAFAPNALDLFNVAYQLGIAANFESVPFPEWRVFDDLEDAIAQARADILNPGSPDVDEVIRRSLEPRLVARDGKLSLQNDVRPLAGIVWWERDRA